MNYKSVQIGEKEISNFSGPFIIADIGSNHKGEIELAKQLIDKAIECGCDSVKFQAWSKNSLFSKQVYQDNKQLEQEIDQFTFGLEKYAELKEYCDNKGILFSASVFCKEEVDFFVDKLDVPYLKIASMDINNLPFLEYVAKKGKVIILPTGMATLAEIDEAVRTINKYNQNLILLHCVSSYPVKDENSNLNNMDLLRNNFDHPVGYSDHTIGIAVSLASAAKGACIIEKHFALDNQDPKIWDLLFSANPEELKRLVNESKRIVKALGNYRIVLHGDNILQRKKMRRSIVAKRDLLCDSILKEEDLDAKRPGTGLEPKYLKFIIGRTLKKELKKDELIKMEDLV